MKIKSLFLYLPLFLALMIGSVGCSKDDEREDEELAIEGCYEGEVVRFDVDSVSLKITKAPESVVNAPLDSPQVPQMNSLLFVKKSDLKTPAIQEGDLFEFQILRYEEIDFGFIQCLYLYTPKYKCKIRPCN